MAADKEEDWGRVARAVNQRRAELGLRRQEDAAAKAGIGVTTWREIENAKRPGYTTVVMTAVAMALEWPPDMLPRIARGEDPPRIQGEDVVARYDEEIARLSAAVADLQAQLDKIRGGSEPPQSAP